VNGLFFSRTWASIFRPYVSHLQKVVCVWRLKVRLRGRIRAGLGVRINTLENLHVGPDLTLGAGTIIMLVKGKTGPAPKITLGRGVKLGDRNQLAVGAGQTLQIGDETSTHMGCYIAGDVEIGRYCLFSANIFVSSFDHNFRHQPELLIKDQDLVVRRGSVEAQSKKTVIEDDCWIGWGAVLRRGITVGKGSIVGANSVVTKDIPPYSIAVGAPARVVAKRLEYNPPARIDVCEVANLPYLHRGFELRQEKVQDRGGKKALLMAAASQCVLSQGRFQKVRIETYADSISQLAISVNGKPLGSLSLSPGWNEQELDISEPGVFAVDGYNRVDLTVPSTSADRIFFGGIELR